MDKLVYLKGEIEISEDNCKTRRDKYLTFIKVAEKTIADALINLVLVVTDQPTADMICLGRDRSAPNTEDCEI